MSLARLTRKVVALGDRLSKDMQVDVIYTPRASIDAYTKPTLGTPVTVKALVEYVTHEIRSAKGDTIVTKAKVTLLANIAISTEDKITLPSGQIGTVATVASLADPDGGGYYTIVRLGWETSSNAGD